MIKLTEITDDNFDECIELEMTEEQKQFCARNIYSLAQAWLYNSTARPFAIYSDDIMVEFVMLEYDEPEKECGIWRFMIDKKYQNMGYGKEAIKIVLEYIKSNPVFEVIHLSVVPENDIAVKLYKDFGFIDTGEMDDDEMIMVLELNK